MTKYITLAQQKGGVGKSTLAFNICAFLLSLDKKVLAIDSDMPQGTLSASASLVKNPNFSYTTARSALEMSEIQKNVNGVFDFVVTDTPPRVAEISYTAIYVSDIIIVPVTTNLPEIWSAQDLINDLNERFKDVDFEPNVFILWNKHRSNGLTESVRNEAMNSFGCQQFKSTIPNLVAFSKVMGLGKGVTQYTNKNAKNQFEIFGNELLKILD